MEWQKQVVDAAHHFILFQPVYQIAVRNSVKDFPLTAAKVGKQFQTAEQLGARRAILLGDEWPQVKVKTLATREEALADPAGLPALLAR